MVMMVMIVGQVSWKTLSSGSPNPPCAAGDDNVGVVSQEKPESKMIASITGL